MSEHKIGYTEMVETVEEVRTIKEEKHSVSYERREFLCIDGSFIEELGRVYLVDVHPDWASHSHSITACYERCNDVCVTEYDIRKDEVNSLLEEFNEAYSLDKDTGLPRSTDYGVPRLMLTLLCARDIIPAGDYLIDIGW